MGTQRDDIPDSVRNLPSRKSLQLVAETTLYTSDPDGCTRPWCRSQHRRVADRDYQPPPASPGDRDTLPAGRMMVSESFDTIPYSGGADLVSCDRNRNSTDRIGLNTREMSRTPHCPARAEHPPAISLQSCGIPSARVNEHRDAESDSSALTPTRAPIDPSTPQSTREISEATVKSEIESDSASSDEDDAPASKRPRRPNGQGPLRKGRLQEQDNIREICIRVKEWKNLSEVPSHANAIAHILEIIPKIRSAVCQHPRLFVKGGRNPCADNSRRAVKERKRRESERTLFGELSRYYQLPPNKKMWTRPPLLERVIHDLDVHPHLLKPSNESAPEA